MQLVKQFLERFTNLTLPDDTLKRLFIELVKTELNLDILRSQISVRNRVVQLNVSPVIKSEIFMRKQKLLTKLASVLGAKSPIDIR